MLLDSLSLTSEDVLSILSSCCSALLLLLIVVHGANRMLVNRALVFVLEFILLPLLLLEAEAEDESS